MTVAGGVGFVARWGVQALASTAALAWAAAYASACVPSTEVSGTIDGQSFVLVRLDGDAVRVWAFDGALPAITQAVADTSLYVLAYDRPLDELPMDAGPYDRVALAEPGASLDASWPLPPPARWAAMDATSGALAVGTAALPPAVASVRTLRPPCPTLQVRPLPYGEPADVANIRVVDPAVGRAVVTTGPMINNGVRITPRIYSLTATSGLEERDSPGAIDLGGYAPKPHLVDDGVELRLVWGRPGPLVPPPPVWATTYAVTATAGLRAPRPLINADGSAPSLEAIASRVEGARRTTVYHASPDALWAARDDGMFARVAVGTASAALCDQGTYTHLFELEDLDRGLWGLTGGPMYTFDLREPGVLGPRYGPPEAEVTCRGARVVDGGDELLVWSTPLGGSTTDGHVAWRRAGQEAWTMLPEDDDVSGSCAAIVDDVFVVCVSGLGAGVGAVALYERDRRRPELPPRRCGVVSAGLEPRAIARTAEGALAGGFKMLARFAVRR